MKLLISNRVKNLGFSSFILFSLLSIPATTIAETSVTDQIKNEASGVGRFRGGWFAGGGYGGAKLKDDTVPLSYQGFLAQGGLYGMFTPIKNFVDIEAGVLAKLNTGMSSKNKNDSNSSSSDKYYNGYYGVTGYAGPIIVFGSAGTKALGFGIYKDFALKEIGSATVKDTITGSVLPKNDLTNGVGAYLEYQMGSQKERELFYVRLEAGKMDISNPKYDIKSSTTLFGLTFGIKR